MRRTRIKICGLTRPQDAALAVEAGADALGMVFHPGGPRAVDVAAARAIVAQAGPFITAVGVFVDQSPDEIRRTALAAGLHTVQLQGRQTPDDVAALSGLSVIVAVHVRAAQLAADLESWRSAIPRLPHLRGLLLETAAAGRPGGTGLENDWSAIAAALAAGAARDLPPLIVAGGLTPANVADVVRRLRPAAVDVSSGVEQAPRQKSPEKIRAFIAAVADADRP